MIDLILEAGPDIALALSLAFAVLMWTSGKV
jgi:hypothetical protein